MPQIFVVNSGSSSIKYQLIDSETEEAVLGGLVERIGEPGSEIADHVAGMKFVLEHLGTDNHIVAVGHRVVQGGSLFDRATLITEEVEAQIEELSALAPLHNPANLLGIRAAKIALPDVPHVAIFDTAFHQTIPAEAYTYAIDAEIAHKYGIRKYGAHGTSHKFVSEETAKFMGRPLEELKIIVLHIGNGGSLSAIDGGVCIETSMGMTPLEGLVMGTRSGDLDPAVLIHLHRQAGLSFDEIDVLLNRRSGLLGMAGNSDMRDVQNASWEGDETALAALAVYRHRIIRYLGAYILHLKGVDAIVFTAGIGENDEELRRLVLEGLEFLGIELDLALNEPRSKKPRYISAENSPVKVLVVPTNEELEIARQTATLLAA
ncbi:acetate kinase [Glaciihabitans tibetensis]|uniref:Acetate kinase n=1 Tax=Glaciihabitans tibetensis TaxID=1266600 RepID=A0A2T0V704_9MICO|nr:acetate kinase [Glaciihabitans tibetensis]PRY65931.1 acetate kinase [Glaciihabitans tibetensis]